MPGGHGLRAAFAIPLGIWCLGAVLWLKLFIVKRPHLMPNAEASFLPFLAVVAWCRGYRLRKRTGD